MYQNIRAYMCQLLSVLAIVMCASGCLAVGAVAGYAATHKTYVDGTFPCVSLDDLASTESPKPLCLSYTIGVGKKDNSGRKRIKGFLGKTGLFDPIVKEKNDAYHQMDINRGLVFGPTGCEHVYTAVYRAPGKQPVSKKYRHGHRDFKNNENVPEGFRQVGTLGACRQVDRDFVYKFLLDLQVEGHLR